MAHIGERNRIVELHFDVIDNGAVRSLGVGPLDEPYPDGIPTKDARFVASHVWALDADPPITVVAGVDLDVRATAPFATPAALVAMKLHAIETRRGVGQDKRAGDAWDLYRILVDLDADATVRNALATGSSWSV